MARGRHRAATGHGRARRVLTRAAWAAVTVAAASAGLSASAPGAPMEAPARVAQAVTRPAEPRWATARAEVLALADAALADAEATARAVSSAPPQPALAPGAPGAPVTAGTPEASGALPGLLDALDDAAARLRAVVTPGGRGPVSPPPGTAVTLAQRRAAVDAVLRAAADVRAAHADTPSTVAVRWATPDTLTSLEEQVGRLAEAGDALRRRAPLTRADGAAGHGGDRGSDRPVTDADLCALPFAAGERLRCDAARALGELNAAYRADHGRDLVVTSAYRTSVEQAALRASLGSLAAVPGTSRHERGVAVDLGGVGGLGEFGSAAYRWLSANAPRYGWVQPAVLGPGGSGPGEPWHWEYVG